MGLQRLQHRPDPVVAGVRREVGQPVAGVPDQLRCPLRAADLRDAVSPQPHGRDARADATAWAGRAATGES